MGRLDIGKSYKTLQYGKIHVMYILDSYYDDEKLVVFRVYGKRKQWWHFFVESESFIRCSIKHFKARLKKE